MKAVLYSFMVAALAVVMCALLVTAEYVAAVASGVVIVFVAVWALVYLALYSDDKGGL